MGDVAVRIYGDKTELFIDRDYEADAIEKMTVEGISPKLIKYLPERSVTIVVTKGYEGKYSEPMNIIDWEYTGMALRYYSIVPSNLILLSSSPLRQIN